MGTFLARSDSPRSRGAALHASTRGQPRPGASTHHRRHASCAYACPCDGGLLDSHRHAARRSAVSLDNDRRAQPGSLACLTAKTAAEAVVAELVAKVRCKDEQLELACLGSGDGDA